MATTTHISRKALRLSLSLLLLTTAALLLRPAPRVAEQDAQQRYVVRSLTISYTAHDGRIRSAVVLLPSWYGPARHPAIPLVIAPHGRSCNGRINAAYWGNLPARGGFAVINPDGMGRRLGNYSYGDPGQIDDLARMPEIAEHALPWLRIDHTRIYALGSSMGGQETLLLVARHPRLLAGAAAMDAVTDLARRYRELPTTKLQATMRTEVGGVPRHVPGAYAARSPMHFARSIASSGVPLQIWWSRNDRIVTNQKGQSGRLFSTLRRLDPEAPLVEYVGRWPHSREMHDYALLPIACAQFGLISWDYARAVAAREPADMRLPSALTA